MNAPTMLDAALEYAAHGWPIFPLAPKGKTPLTAHGFKDATTEEEQIRAWWTETPDANIGTPTGLVTRRSVVDEDNKPWRGATGSQTMAALATLFGALPETLSQTTWSGGKQHLFAYNPEAVNSAHSYGEYVDGRNDGGYIAIPPSHVVAQAQAINAFAQLAVKLAEIELDTRLLDAEVNSAGPTGPTIIIREGKTHGQA